MQQYISNTSQEFMQLHSHFSTICYQTIIFIRDQNNRNQEVSGYIDYAHRLKVEDFDIYFSGKKKLMPKPSDLRFAL